MAEEARGAVPRQQIPDGELRDRLVASIHRRAKFVAKVTSPKHACSQVDTVLAMFAAHLLETCLLLLGETFEREWASRIFQHTLEAHGICRFCGEQPLVKETGMCAACWKRAADDDATAEEICHV